MEKKNFWCNHYPNGVAANINEDDKRTLNDLFVEATTKYAKNPAITSHAESITFKKTKVYVNNLATNLLQLGVKNGDRVAVIMPNVMQYPLSIFAILKIGAIVVNINPLYTAHEIDYLLENSGAKVVIVLNLMAAKLNNLYDKYGLKHIIVAKVPDTYPLIKRLVINFVIKYIKRMSVSYKYKALSFRSLVLKNSSLAKKIPKIERDHLAFIQYTSATTGKPKGVMLSHKNIVANINQINAWLQPQMANLDKQITISALPLYHIFSLTANLFTFFFAGSENVMIINPHDVKTMVKVLTTTPFTIFSALDTLYNHLLRSKQFTKHKYPNFKYSVAGGMPLRKSVANEWFKLTKVMPINCYGLTEASPAVTLNPLDGSFDGSVGFPIPSTAMEIRDLKTGEPLGINETGLVWVRGPQLTSGYWNNPEQTKLAFDQNGWFNTKDIGSFNDKGKLTLSARQSEMIIVSGFNVYPAEVEANLNDFTEIKESAIVGIPYRATGEMVIAFIVFKPGCKLTRKEIISKCHTSLTGYKIPRRIYVVDELPKTLIGKIDKVALLRDYIHKKHH